MAAPTPLKKKSGLNTQPSLRWPIRKHISRARGYWDSIPIATAGGGKTSTPDAAEGNDSRGVNISDGRAGKSRARTPASQPPPRPLAIPGVFLGRGAYHRTRGRAVRAEVRGTRAGDCAGLTRISQPGRRIPRPINATYYYEGMLLSPPMAPPTSGWAEGLWACQKRSPRSTTALRGLASAQVRRRVHPRQPEPPTAGWRYQKKGKISDMSMFGWPAHGAQKSADTSPGIIQKSSKVRP